MTGRDGALRRRRVGLACVAGTLAFGFVAAACSGSSAPVDSDDGPKQPEPVGEVLDLSGPGIHQIPGPPIEHRSFPAQVWTGEELVVWGGQSAESDGSSGRIVATGATLSLDDGRWTSMPDSPFAEGLYRPLGAWDGEEVIVIGTRCTGEVPPVTEGGVPTCPRGPTAAAWNPTTRAWRELPSPPIPIDAFHEAAVVSGETGAAGGDGGAVFAFGYDVATIGCDREAESWVTIEGPWSDGTQVDLCADPVDQQLVAIDRLPEPDPESPRNNTIWTIAPGATAWTTHRTKPFDASSSFSCGSGHVVPGRFVPNGYPGEVVDIASGSIETVPTPTDDLQFRQLDALGAWLHSDNATRSDEPWGGEPIVAALRLVDGDEWTTVGRSLNALFNGDTRWSPATYVDDGVLVGQMGTGGDVRYWHAPPELQTD